MSCICDDQWYSLGIDCCQNTPWLPGVEFTIAEDNVWDLHEVFCGIFAAIVIEYPIELRFFVVRWKAPVSGVLRRPCISWEHSCFTAGKWLGNFVAVEHVPSVLWDAFHLRWGVLVKAFKLMVIIVESASSSCQRIEIGVLLTLMLLIRLYSLITSVVHRPSRQGS